MSQKRKWKKQKQAFLALFATLLENGFSIQESLGVIERSHLFETPIIKKLRQQLAQGTTLAQCFSKMEFTDKEITQIELSQAHGNLTDTLKSMVEHQKMVTKQKNELKKIATYPVMLLLFMLVLFFGMRQFLLPQLLETEMVDQTHWGIGLLIKGPVWLGGIVLFLLLAGLLFGSFLHRKSATEKAKVLGKIPIAGRWYRMYQTSYFSLEWGNLFQQGLEMKQILTYLTSFETASLMTELAKELNEGLQKGRLLTQQLPEYTFLTPEFSLIIFQGEIKGKLGTELLLYSQLLTKRWVEDVEKALQWIQPIVFLMVAVMILSIYIAMFLPIYDNIGGAYL